MYELIITEKPNAAKMIAQALSDSKPIKESIQGVPYYKLSHGNTDIVVGCAVGHLFTVAEKIKSFKYPVFDLEWKPSSEIDEKSYTKKYAAVLKKIAKDAKYFTVATDYDIEGEVIGLNCIRFLCKQKDASRMKFSTLTKGDIVAAYNDKSPTLDWGQANAGETRHFMDWMYGINLSRALTLAIKNTGMYKTMSSGRVQGPALKLIVDKEKEIKAFKSQKYYQLSLNGEVNTKNIEFWHETDRFFDEQQAIGILQKIKDSNGKIIKIQISEFIQRAPAPFDLTTLQTEAYRVFGISPKQTLEIAQELYTSGYISYPRTSSQKLPKELGFKKIFDQLSKNPLYTDLTKKLPKELVPQEGKKTDPAHPAIYPTGIEPKVRDRTQKIYDLIVKRFFSCFAQDAKRETVTIYADFSGEKFLARGTRTVFEGWHMFYRPYVILEEQEMPRVKENDTVQNKGVIKHDKETQPPKRYTPASIIRELEKQDLGTKATRANIIDSLYQRNYVKNESLEATELGIQTVETLEKYSPEILDAKLTRHFEKEMEKVRQKKFTEEAVLKEAENTLIKILDKFKKNEKAIGNELKNSHRQSLEAAAYIGPCPKCKVGTLKIMYSKKSKRKFIACDKYPECKTIMNMPGYGIIKSTEKICDKCGFPIIKILAGRNTRETCLNIECPSKQDSITTQKAITGKKCAKCGKDMVLRKSVYGQFLGCSGYPKCRNIEKLEKKEKTEGADSQDKNVTLATPMHSAQTAPVAKVSKVSKTRPKKSSSKKKPS